jgi:ornithine cyclodeaminase/alanine dehydrogenase-like protein (mu-crystallin family)
MTESELLDLAWTYPLFEIRPGTALQDVAAAAAVYRRALEHGEGTRHTR